jgi:hypothetical protein
VYIAHIAGGLARVVGIPSEDVRDSPKRVGDENRLSRMRMIFPLENGMRRRRENSYYLLVWRVT